MKIINVKLINGDEIVAKLVSSDNDEYMVISQPRALSFNAQGTGAAFIPALIMSNDGEIKLYKNSIALYNENVGSEYEKHYLQSVSGIQLATTLNG